MVVTQIVFGALLQTTACEKDSWGIVHIILGSLTAISLPKMCCNKCAVGERAQRPQAPVQAQVQAQAQMAANAAHASAGGEALVRNDSILLTRKLQPEADPAMMAERMEKPLSPMGVQLLDKLSRVECTTCNGTGMLEPGVTAVFQPRGDTSITYDRFTTPPTISSISTSSPLHGQLHEGDTVLRVAYRVRIVESSDALVRSRTAGEAFDCHEWDGAKLTDTLKVNSVSDLGREWDVEIAEAKEQVLTILPRGAAMVGSAVRRAQQRKQSGAINCLVCRGHGNVDQFVGSFEAPQEADEHPCEICYNDSKYGVSTECLHFYCEDCIRGSLEAILDQGQFPAYCPACRMESEGIHDETAKGKIQGPALTFLQSKDVITLDFQFRFMRQQDQSEEKFFKCPASGCSAYLIDQDPQYAIVARGTSEVEGFERKMRLGKCECGARVCVRCHAQATPEIRRALEKLAEVTKDPLPELEKMGGVSHWSTLKMDAVADMLSIKHDDLIEVEAARVEAEVVARTYSGNLLPPPHGAEILSGLNDLPLGVYTVLKNANVRKECEVTSAKALTADGGKSIVLKAGSKITVLEVRGTRVRHALGWSSAVGSSSGERIMDPGSAKTRLTGRMDRATKTHFLVTWDEQTREVLATTPEMLQEHDEWTAEGGSIELPALWLVVKGQYKHECPTELNRSLSTDKLTLALMKTIGKHCPNCGAFIQKNDGCNIMMCGTTAHGRLADALAHGGCGHLFHWDSLKPAKTFYIGLDGQRVDNYIGGVATDGGGMQP